MTEIVELSSIRIDGGTQSRAGLNMDAVTDYADQMEDGAKFPPIVVFYDGQTYWLADGFHRVEARRRHGMRYIESDVRQGDRLAALRYSLGANDKHGLPRNSQDFRRAYACAVDNNLCKPDDTAAVQKLLNCTQRHAQNLTRVARESAKTERDQKIESLASEGKTQREIAEAVGASKGAVSRVLAPERNCSELGQAPELDQARIPSWEEIERREKMRNRVATDPDKSRLYEEGSCLSAWVLAAKAKTAIQQISKEDPNAVAAIDSIRAALDKQTSIITA